MPGYYTIEGVQYALLPQELVETETYLGLLLERLALLNGYEVRMIKTPVNYIEPTKADEQLLIGLLLGTEEETDFKLSARSDSAM